MPKAILIVLDGVGCGSLPDADRYGDEGSNSIANTAASCESFELPNLQRLGLGNIIPVEGVPAAPEPTAGYGKMNEQSPGKDTTTGHLCPVPPRLILRRSLRPCSPLFGWPTCPLAGQAELWHNRVCRPA